MGDKIESKQCEIKDVARISLYLTTVMGWLRLVGSFKWQVSFAKEPCKRDYILQKRPKNSRSLLIVATPYMMRTLTMELFLSTTAKVRKYIMKNYFLSETNKDTAWRETATQIWMIDRQTNSLFCRIRQGSSSEGGVHSNVKNHLRHSSYVENKNQSHSSVSPDSLWCNYGTSVSPN